MKLRTVFYTGLGIILFFCSHSFAQTGLVNADHREKDRAEQKEKKLKGFILNEKRPLKTEPILMAGDERFQKMLLIALAPQDQVDKKMQQWPLLKKVNPERKDQLLKEIEAFRKRINRSALKSADEAGIVLTEEQKPAFIKSYWEKRSKVETPLRLEVEAKLKAAMELEMAALKQEFSR